MSEMTKPSIAASKMLRYCSVSSRGSASVSGVRDSSTTPAPSLTIPPWRGRLSSEGGSLSRSIVHLRAPPSLLATHCTRTHASPPERGLDHLTENRHQVTRG